MKKTTILSIIAVATIFLSTFKITAQKLVTTKTQNNGTFKIRKQSSFTGSSRNF